MNGLRARLGMVALAAVLMFGVAGFAGVAPVSAAFNNGDSVVVIDGSLNLRQTAGLTGVILQVLPEGTPLTVTGASQMADALEWYPVVTAGAVAGFVVSDFIELAGGGGEFTAGDDIVVADGPLNLRNAAGTGGTILKTLPTGTTGTVLAGPTAANGMDWYQIQAGADVGWVAGDFLDLASAPSGEFSAGDDIVVADGPLNLRNAAGTGGTILKTLPTGTTGTVLAGPTAANGMDWYQIQAGADVGWVAGDYLDLASAPPAGEFEVGDDIVVDDGPLNLRDAAGTGGTILKTLPTGTTGTVLAGPTAANGTDWYQIQAGADVGWVAGDFLALQSGGPSGGFAMDSYVFVNVAKLNLRSTASTDAAVVTTMIEGTVAQVVGGPTSADGYEWYQLDVNGTEGWAVGEYLVGGIVVGGVAIVADGPINLRVSPSTGSQSLGAIPQGASVSITSGPTAGGNFIWFGASYNGQNGFVAGEFLTGS